MRPPLEAKLIVIDECSMVDAELGRDLMSFGVPLLVLGDPAQLPPIQGGGFFTDAEPDAMLTEVHRQAQDDPIVRLSMEVRDGQRLSPANTASSQVVRRARARSRARARCRSGAGRPQRDAARLQCAHARAARLRGCRCRMPGDKLVCLRNNRRKGLFNGGLWVVKDRQPKAAPGILGCGSRPTRTRVGAPSRCRCGPNASRARSSSSNGSSASAMTSSTSAMCSPCTSRRARNGTTWCCSTRCFAFPDSRERWLYTGITRAAKRLTVVV